MATRQQIRRRRRRNLLKLLLTLAVIVAAVITAVKLHGARSEEGSLAPEQPAATAPVAETAPTEPAPTQPPRTYTADGHYIQTSVPSWELRLVNPWNPLPEEYDYEENLAVYSGKNQFDTRAMNALRQMLAAGGEYNLWPVSLYRDYALQTSLYNRQVAKVQNNYGLTGQEALDKAATVVARPGTSEHHTGLAADILGSGFPSLDEEFEDTPAFAWLKAHCAEYGFILRYTKEKEPVTGVIYEPWHYRYVGVEAATEIMDRGITLEEYLEEKGL